MRSSKAQLGFSAIFSCLGIGLTITSTSMADVSGAALVRPCLTCHQTGHVQGASVADLASLPREDFQAAIADFREFPDEFIIMGRIAAAYSDAELASIVMHFSSLKGSAPQ